MSIYVKNGGVWQLPRRIYVKTGGAWAEPRNIYVNSGGVWKKEYATITLAGTNLNVNCASLFGTDAMTAVLINNGVIGSANSGPALDATGMNGNSTLYIVNNAYIVGLGGFGGPGGGGGGSNGGNGSDAISMHCALLLDNFGVIGGGGGGGAGAATWPGHAPQCGGGGGGAGQNPGPGGAGYAGGAPGTAGTLTTGGIWQPQFHCVGGNGGNLGAAGQSSGSCDAQPGATGGSPGWAIRLNGFGITYRTVGSIQGTVG